MGSDMIDFNLIITFFAVVTEKYWPAVIRNAPSLRGRYVLTKGQYFSVTNEKKVII